jgi:hypothetical protein
MKNSLLNISNKVLHKILNNKPLNENESTDLLLKTILGIKKRKPYFRSDDYTLCGASIELALNEAFRHGTEYTKKRKTK